MSTEILDARVYRPISRRAPHAATYRQQPRLRLTSRGRSVLVALAATPIIIVALMLLNGGGANASLEGSSATFDYVTVATGQSLWQLAESIAPDADPRGVINDIMVLNQLESADVFAGQELAIPLDYER